MKFRHGLAACLALLAAPQLTVAAAAEWRMVTTPQFTVLSQASEQKTQQWVRNYQQFISATSAATGIKPTALPPLTVVLFARDKEFTQYKIMRPDGKAARVAGQFMRMAGMSIIGVAADAEQAEARRTIYHEGAHWLMSREPFRHPTWFAEGIAEMLSTFELNGSKVNWAKPIESHLAQLKQNGLLPLKEFLARTDALQDQERDDDRFYAQSWAFVHYMMLSPSRIGLLDRVLAESRKSSSEEAVTKVFGANLAAMEKDFNHYVQQAAFNYVTLAVEAAAAPPPSVVAPPGVVEAALGYMALMTDRKELAQQHAQRAVEQAADRPGGHEVLALLARRNDDDNAARRHVEAAIRAGTRSSEMYLMMADAIGRERAGGFQTATAARIPLLHQSIALEPANHRAYRQLAFDLMQFEKPAAADLQMLAQGGNRFPEDDWIKVGLAAASMRLGEGNDVLQVIETALRPGSSLTDNERRTVGTVRRNLLMQTMDAELRTTQTTRDFAAARAIIARYRALAGDDKEIADYLQRRDNSFEMSQLLERMESALANDRRAALPKLFEQILAHPALTPQIRERLETSRRRIGL